MCEISFNLRDSTDETGKKINLSNEIKEMYLKVIELVETLGQAEKRLADAEFYKVYPYGPDDNSKCIDKWLRTDGKKMDPGKQKILDEWLSAIQDKPDIPTFLDTKKYANDREKFVKDKDLKCP